MSITTSVAGGTAVTTGRSVRVRKFGERVLIYFIIVLGVILTGAPFLSMITGSFKLNAEIFSYPLTFMPKAPTLENYQRLLNGSEIPFVRQFVNSLVVAVSQTFLTLFVASLVGWGFAKFEFAGKQVLFIFLLATLTFPYQVTLVPLFLLMVRIGSLDASGPLSFPAVECTSASSFYAKPCWLSRTS